MARVCSEYDITASQHYMRPLSYNTLCQTGPDERGGGGAWGGGDDESDAGDDPGDDLPAEDHHVLLIKAWETRVFPTIRRRFRNEAERKDGLEQIRGALQLGGTPTASLIYQLLCFTLQSFFTLIVLIKC